VKRIVQVIQYIGSTCSQIFIQISSFGFLLINRIDILSCVVFLGRSLVEKLSQLSYPSPHPKFRCL